jgi:Tol biopolymer transport system component
MATVVSPDGRAIVFRAQTDQDRSLSLWVRKLDSKTGWTLLPGTAGAECPFWSPDSQAVAFVQGGKLRRTAMTGGSPSTLADVAGQCRGGTWGRAGTIVLSDDARLVRVPASGGTPQPVRAPDTARQERILEFPQFLPDGRHFLFYAQSGIDGVRGTDVSSIDAPAEATRILPGALATYVAPDGAYPGFVLWSRGQTLVAQRFDAGHLRLDGDPSPVADNVASVKYGAGLALFSASNTGVLAYRIGTGTTSTLARSTLTWLDRTGHAVGTIGDRESYGELALSPDGSRVAVFREDGAGQNLWFIDVARGASARLTTGPGNQSSPVWSSDGTQLVFESDRNASCDLYRKPAGVSAQAEVLLKSQGYTCPPTDWSRDGRYLLYSQASTRIGDWDLWVLPMGAGGKPTPYLATPFVEASAKFSPDGHWVAYQSNQSTRFEIYVSSFPDAATAPAALVSTAGGTFPRWSHDGRALYYVSADNELMEVPVTPGATFKAGTPAPLFKLPPLQQLTDFVGRWPWDVTPDGRRFLVNTAPTSEGPAPMPLIVDTDWRAKLPR